MGDTNFPHHETKLFVFLLLSVSAWAAEWQWSVPDFIVARTQYEDEGHCRFRGGSGQRYWKRDYQRRWSRQCGYPCYNQLGIGGSTDLACD
jgi:hypothetical protein